MWYWVKFSCFLCGVLENVVYLFLMLVKTELNKRCCYIWHNSWNVRRVGVVKILPSVFDLFSEKLTERMWKLSSWNVGRKRTEFGFTKQSVC